MRLNYASEGASSVPVIHDCYPESILTYPDLLSAFGLCVAQVSGFPNEVFKGQCRQAQRQAVDRTDACKEGFSGHEGKGRRMPLRTWSGRLCLEFPGCTWMSD